MKDELTKGGTYPLGPNSFNILFVYKCITKSTNKNQLICITKSIDQ